MNLLRNGFATFGIAVLWCVAAAAALPPHAGHGKGQTMQGQGYGPATTPFGFAFSDKDRAAIVGYYQPAIAAGKCPPGLAKKGNGCLPPGQARNYTIGQPLPAGVTTYPLPPDLLMRLSPPPVGYQYSRIGSDIVLLGTGTGMVAAALQDLVR